MSDLPLGQSVPYPVRYAPEVLRAVPRATARAELGLSAPLPFSGVDVWNAWELAWLEPSGKPAVGTARFFVDATSPNIVESKSLKLYLNSIAYTEFQDVATLETRIAHDLGEIVGTAVRVHVDTLPQVDVPIAHPEGSPLDALEIRDIRDAVTASFLNCDRTQVAEEVLHSNLLRSLCPVTGQPDTGTVLIRYRGPKIDRQGLLSYIVSFRDHNDFHESCAERVFMDLQQRCECEWLTVYLRYNRRGGIDINPFRSNYEREPTGSRLWRQ